ncbi:MAG: histidinol-phosphate transaminase [Burkholderiaceae bacterium]
MSDPAAVSAAATIRTDVQAMSVYPVASAAGFVKLDAMENPYTLPDAMRQELGERLALAALNRYPAPDCANLEAALRSAADAADKAIPADALVVFGNGSDELIALIVQACCAPGDVVLAPEPTFVMYGISARLCHARFIGVPLRAADFALDVPAMLEAIRTHRPKVTFLAYPNNPTGNAFDQQAVLDIIAAAAPGLVVIDEAYEAFASQSFMCEVGRWPNMIVLRTLSKLGLAGIRLGYAAGPRAWLAQVDKVRPPYNVNILTRITAQYVLEHAFVLDRQTAALCAQRDVLAAALASTPGVDVFASNANFLLFRCPGAPVVFDALKAQKILVKNVGGLHPLLSDCLRVTVSTPEENQLFLCALQKVLAL